MPATMPARSARTIRHGVLAGRLATCAAVGAMLAVGSVVPTPAAAAPPAPGVTVLASLSSAGVQGNQDSHLPAMSANGRFVAFASLSDNLVPGDTNIASDVFVRDRLTGTTERVSVSSRGREGNESSGLLQGLSGPSISGDGRFVAFDSIASNLVRGDTNGQADVFVHDRQTGATERVSVASDGTQANADSTAAHISRDGRLVAFTSFAENLVPDLDPGIDFGRDMFVHDRSTGVTERISEGFDGTEADGESFDPLLNADGRFVYFTSFAANLVAGDRDNDDLDAYVFDRQAGTMESITANRGSAETFVLNHGTATGISGDGRFLTFVTADDGFVAPDTNGFAEDAWLVDRATGEYVLVGVNDSGEQGDDATFADGVSDDGRIVALTSLATNFGGPATVRQSVYVRDRAAGVTRIVSVATDGTDGDRDSNEPWLSPDGSQVAFASRATTFVPETQEFFASDIFVRDERPRADLSVAKTDSPDPVVTRAALTYTVMATNNGPGAATDVTLVDTLPEARVTSVTASQGSCEFTATANTLRCDLGSLDAGGTATVSIVIRAPRPGTITNTATAVANEPDTDRTNNTATETTTVLPG